MCPDEHMSSTIIALVLRYEQVFPIQFMRMGKWKKGGYSSAQMWRKKRNNFELN